MSDRRKRIKEAIWSGMQDLGSTYDGDFSWDQINAKVESATDLVLDTLKDDLLPELPEWVMKQTAWSGGMDWKVALNDYEPEAKDVRRAYGTGPTIPAAIRNALEQNEPELFPLNIKIDPRVPDNCVMVNGKIIPLQQEDDNDQ